MNKKARVIVEELKKAGLITKEEDLTAGVNTGRLFNYMLNKYSFLLNDDPNIAFPKDKIKDGALVHKFVHKFGKYFLRTPQIIEDRNKLLEGDDETFSDRERNFSKEIKEPDEPTIYVMNHAFKDDGLASLIAIKNRVYMVFGNLAQFYGTLDGIMSAKIGVILVNRKSKKSRGTTVEKAQYLLENGMNILICPEGIWNKTPNKITLNFWEGFYRMAQKKDGTFYPVVPVIHWIDNNYGKGTGDSIHTVIDDPIKLDGMNKDEAINKVKTIIDTWHYKMSEKYGKTTRNQLLRGYDNTSDAWEEEIRHRVALVEKYDYQTETSSDKRSKDDPLLVWEPIANLEFTKNNAKEVASAKKLVKKLKKDDFQHRI